MKIVHLILGNNGLIKKGIKISRHSLMTLIVCGSGCFAISASQEKNRQSCDDALPTNEEQACAQSMYDFNTLRLNKTYQAMQKKIKSKRAHDVAQLKNYPDNP